MEMNAHALETSDATQFLQKRPGRDIVVISVELCFFYEGVFPRWKK